MGGFGGLKPIKRESLNQMSMERYIDVTGESSYREDVARFVADVSVEVRATNRETALGEVSTLADQVIQRLIESGIRETEIVDGGVDFFRQLFVFRKKGQSCARRITLKVDAIARLYQGLESLEPFSNEKKRTLNIRMRQPEFEGASEAKAFAMKAAFQDATNKAKALADEIGCHLGPVLHVQEGKKSLRASGFSGDEDWWGWGDSDRFSRPRHLMEYELSEHSSDTTNDVIPENPTRTVWIQCEVRFTLADKES